MAASRKVAVPKLSEAQIERTCTQFLELDGWRSLKTDPVSRREWAKGFGEPGMADYLYIRYEPEPYDVHRDVTPPADPPGSTKIGWWQPVFECQAEILWIEWKRLRGS